MVRRATLGDVPQLVVLGGPFHAMANSPVPYDASSMAAFLRETFKWKNAAIFVMEHDGQIVGAAGVILAPVFFNFAFKTATEMFWFVAENFRGKESLKLFNALEDWAHEQGAITMTMIALAVNPGIADLYKRTGYELLETHYAKRLATIPTAAPPAAPEPALPPPVSAGGSGLSQITQAS